MKYFLLLITAISFSISAHAATVNNCNVAIAEHLSGILNKTITINGIQYPIDERICSGIDSTDYDTLSTKLYSGSEYLQDVLTKLNSSYAEQGPVLANGAQLVYFPESNVVRIGIRKPSKTVQCSSVSITDVYDLKETYLPPLNSFLSYSVIDYINYLIDYVYENKDTVIDNTLKYTNISFASGLKYEYEAVLQVTKIVDGNEVSYSLNKPWWIHRTEGYTIFNMPTPVYQKPKNMRPESHYVYIYDSLDGIGNSDITYRLDYILDFGNCTSQTRGSITLDFSEYFDIADTSDNNGNTTPPSGTPPNPDHSMTWMVPIMAGIILN
ncbi:MAG: hypothetical protein AB7E76_04355 [Deferribacterales bacterium]